MFSDILMSLLLSFMENEEKYTTHINLKTYRYRFSKSLRSAWKDRNFDFSLIIISIII